MQAGWWISGAGPLEGWGEQSPGPSREGEVMLCGGWYPFRRPGS